MTTSTELVPFNTLPPQFAHQFSMVDERQYSQQKYQPWSPEATQNPFVSNPPTPKNETALSSCKKHLNTKFFMSILLGLMICGVPLAVMSSLYVQKKNTSSGSSSGSSDNSYTNLPSQCKSYYTNTDPTRLATFTGCLSCPPETSTYFPTGWYRFMNGAGTRLVTMPPAANVGYCGASYPIWYNGSYPSTTGSTVNGIACVHFGTYLCHSSYPLTTSITNCGDYFVFYLTTPSSSNMRYCTTF